MKNYLLLFLCIFVFVWLMPIIFELVGIAPENDVQAFENSEVSEVTINEKNLLKLKDASNGKISLISVDDYVSAVLTYEKRCGLPEETLKAHAVLVRTYAMKNIGKHGDADLCTDPTHCRGVEFDIPSDIAEGVKETSGQTIKYEGKYIDPLTHISSHGKTESAFSVTGMEIPYLVPVDTFEREEGKIYEYTVSELAELLTKNGYATDGSIRTDSWITYTSYTDGGRIKMIYICGYAITGTKLMQILGTQSTDIHFSLSENGFTVICYGSGNGLGLSEKGAVTMAINGNNYTEIILHYFPGTNIDGN